MKVICKVKECKYCSESNFCTKVFVIINPAGGCGRLYDNNGTRSPNRYGKDVFAFTLWNDGSLKPVGGRGWLGNATTDTWVQRCNTASVVDGAYCTGAIFENNLKVIYQ